MQQPTVNLSSHEAVCAILIEATNKLLTYSGRHGSTHIVPSTGQLLVTGDLHDNPIHLTKIVQLANLDVPTNHVLFQELIHSSGESAGEDLSYRMLVRIASLLCSFPSQVHPILANHELSQATDRAITKGGGELVIRFNQGVQHVFGKHAGEVLEALNSFIMAMPLAVQTESGLMCLHSLPNELAMEEFDTTVLQRELKQADYMGPFGAAYMTVWGRQLAEEQVNRLAEEWGVTLFCLGHAWVPEGIDIALPNVIQINSDHNKGVVLPIQLDAIQNARRTVIGATPLSSVSLNPAEL
jgi:hypothetical protein